MHNKQLHHFARVKGAKVELHKENAFTTKSISAHAIAKELEGLFQYGELGGDPETTRLSLIIGFGANQCLCTT